MSLILLIGSTKYKMGFPGGSDGKESDCNAGDLGLIPELGWSPGGGRQSTPVFLPGESHGQRSYSPWGYKESDTTEWLSTHQYKIKS